MADSKQGRLAEIEKELEELHTERSNILNSMLAEQKAKNRARVDAWGVQERSSMILFAKKAVGYHWWIAKTIKVTEIDYENEYIDAIEANYGEADYEYYCKIENRRIPFSSLEELEKEFNIYFVDDVQLTILQQHFCSLKLDYKNYKHYEDTFAKAAERAFKIPFQS
jgi:hypothetical protein